MLSFVIGTFDVGPYLCAFLLAILSALVSTRLVRDFALRRDWVVAPSLLRHMHRRPVPRIGGVAIYASSWLTAIVVLLTLAATDVHAAKVAAFRLLTIFVPATFVFGIGLADDFRNLSAKTKVAAQTLAALFLYCFGLRVTHLGPILGSSTLSPILSLPLTVAWVLAITNAFNLIDGLDGLAAGSAFFSTAVVFAVSIFQGSPFIAVLVAGLGGSILGFLRYNFNPASIFLGDSGSLYIGFVLSAAALAGSQKSSTLVAVAAPVVSFGLPILDISIAILRRFLRGRPLFEADAEHIHHKLLKRGFSHRGAVLILYCVSAIFGLLGLLLYPSGDLIALVLAVIGLGLFFGLKQLRYHEFGELQRVAHQAINQKRVIANNLAIHGAAEALEACNSFIEIGACIVEHLKPTGLDAFALEAPDLARAPGPALAPFVRTSSGQLLLGCAPEANSFAFRLEFGLPATAGPKGRSFSALRASCDGRLWMDANVFVSSGFTAALNGAIQRACRHVEFFQKLGEPSEESAMEHDAVPLGLN